jgi:hypothetical protein
MHFVPRLDLARPNLFKQICYIICGDKLPTDVFEGQTFTFLLIDILQKVIYSTGRSALLGQL